MAYSNSDILDCFNILASEARELYLRPEVPTVQSIEALEFQRNYVSSNLPVLVKGGVNHWPATKKWGIDYFRKIMMDKEVTVAVTPNGYADAIATKCENNENIQYFVMPEERLMRMAEFLDVLENPNKYSGVFYIQQQNSNLTKHFPELLCDVSFDIPWAADTFGQFPDAFNFWMGDERAITSMHRDPYENIYCVVSGYKDFILLPPTDRPWVPYKHFPPACYKETSPGYFEIVPKTPKEMNGKVSSNLNCSEFPDNLIDKSDIESESCYKDNIPWICIDPLNPDLKTYPLYKNANPVRVRVEAGDVLYLPSLWFHHVRQSHSCIAVNYWYDMNYDIKYAYLQLVEALVKKFNINESCTKEK